MSNNVEPAALGDLEPLKYTKVQGEGEHPTFESVLHRAHRNVTDRGFTIIGSKVRLVCPPTKDNEMTAIFEADVTMRDDEGNTYTFSGIGDANPDNVRPHMRPSFIRIGATRAMGRALREALNIAEALDDEIGDGTAENVTKESKGGSSGGGGSSSSSSSSSGGKAWDGMLRGKHKGTKYTDLPDDEDGLSYLEWLLNSTENPDDGKTWPDTADKIAKLKAEIAKRKGGGNGGSSNDRPQTSGDATVTNEMLKDLTDLANGKGLKYMELVKMAKSEFSGKSDLKKLTEDEYNALCVLVGNL